MYVSTYKHVYQLTPAFAKAGAAPGTTAGVELVLSENPPKPPPTRPNPPNTVPSRHPRAKATSPTGTPGPRPQQWLSMGFQS